MTPKYLVVAAAAAAVVVPAVSLANSGYPGVEVVHGPAEASAPATRVTMSNSPPSDASGLAVWTDADAGDGRQPTIVIDDSVYPNHLGVQFFVNGEVDDRRPRSRPNGYDATGPQEGSKYHIYPDISLSPGDVIEARWADRSSVARSSQVTVEGSGEPVADSPPPPPPPPPAPSIDGFPSPTNVGFLGATATLTPSGSLTVTTDGAVIEGRDITGVIKIRANNVTIRGNRIVGVGGYWIDVGNGTSGHLIEDNTILGPAPNTATGYTNRAIFLRPGTGGSPINVTIRRNLILRSRVGIGGNARNTVIEENYIGDNWYKPGSHGTASSLNGADGVIYRGNTLSMPNPGTSSCTALYGFYPINDVTYDGNLFLGGDNLHYAINGGYDTPKDHDPTNVTIINNVFERATVPNPFLNVPSHYVRTGNVWDDGTPI